MLHKRYTYLKQGDTNNMTVNTNKKYVRVNIVYMVGKILSLHIFCFWFWSKREKKTFFFVQTKMENENDEYNDMYNKVIPFQCNNNQNVYNYMLNIIFFIYHYCYYGLDYFGTQMVINK